MKKVIWLIVFIFCINCFNGCKVLDLGKIWEKPQSPECDITFPSQEEQSQQFTLTRSVLGSSDAYFRSNVFSFQDKIYPTSSGYYVVGLLDLDLWIKGVNK